jgi:hypothetical protein
MMITYGGSGRRIAAAQTKRGAMRQQIALAIVLALSAGTVALAETAEEQQACTNDAFQFCQNFIPDRNRVFTCLVNNRDQLSAACHTVMAPYLPPEPVALKKPPAPHDKSAAKSKGPINLAPH